MLAVKGFEIQALLIRAITANWADIDHGVAEFNEAATLDWNVQVCNVVQDEVNQLFIFFFAQKANEALIFFKKQMKNENVSNSVLDAAPSFPTSLPIC